MTTPSEAVRVAVQLAQRFHETYERLAPSFGYETRAETKVFDPESPNGKLMIAVCAALSLHVGDAADVQSDASGASASPTGLCGLRPEPQSVSALRAPIPGADAPDSIDRAMAFEATLVDQQFFHTETAKGDCFRACIATILRKPIQAVPHFALLDLAPDVFVAMECAMAWLNSKGYEMWMNLDDGEDPLPLCIVSGVSPRGIPHAVVGDTTTGAIVHDPHPSRAGLSHISNRLYLFPVAAQGQHAAQAIVTREGQDPQGLGGEAIERGPAGMRPEDHERKAFEVAGLWDEWQAASAQPSLHIEPALGYAQRLAEAIWSKYYKADAPHWKPLDDVLGVLTQIDNMTSGLSRSPTTPTEGPAQPTSQQGLAALKLLKHIRGHARRHDLDREWLTLADEVLGTWGPPSTERVLPASTLTDPEGAS